MKGKSYTFFIASSASGGMRRVSVPVYAVPLLTILAVVGGITVAAGMGSYSRMLWKATNYNSLRREQDNLKQQYVQLQTQVKDTNQRLNSLQSLAGEVAMAYGITRFRQTPFGLTDSTGEADPAAISTVRGRIQLPRKERDGSGDVEQRSAAPAGRAAEQSGNRAVALARGRADYRALRRTA